MGMVKGDRSTTSYVFFFGIRAVFVDTVPNVMKFVSISANGQY